MADHVTHRTTLTPAHAPGVDAVVEVVRNVDGAPVGTLPPVPIEGELPVDWAFSDPDGLGLLAAWAKPSVVDAGDGLFAALSDPGQRSRLSIRIGGLSLFYGHVDPFDRDDELTASGWQAGSITFSDRVRVAGDEAALTLGQVQVQALFSSEVPVASGLSASVPAVWHPWRPSFGVMSGNLDRSAFDRAAVNMTALGKQRGRVASGTVAGLLGVVAHSWRHGRVVATYALPTVDPIPAASYDTQGAAAALPVPTHRLLSGGTLRRERFDGLRFTAGPQGREVVAERGTFALGQRVLEASAPWTSDTFGYDESLRTYNSLGTGSVWEAVSGSPHSADETDLADAVADALAEWRLPVRLPAARRERDGLRGPIATVSRLRQRTDAHVPRCPRVVGRARRTDDAPRSARNTSHPRYVVTASRILRRLTLLPETGVPVSFDAASEYAFAEAFDVRVALDGDELRARTGYRMSALVLDTDAIERIAAWASAGVRVTAFAEGESVHAVWADPVVPSLSAPEEGEPQMLWGRRLLLSTARASAPVAETSNLLALYGWAGLAAPPEAYTIGGANPSYGLPRWRQASARSPSMRAATRRSRPAS